MFVAACISSVQPPCRAPAAPKKSGNPGALSQALRCAGTSAGFAPSDVGPCHRPRVGCRHPGCGASLGSQRLVPPSGAAFTSRSTWLAAACVAPRPARRGRPRGPRRSPVRSCSPRAPRCKPGNPPGRGPCPTGTREQGGSTGAFPRRARRTAGRRNPCRRRGRSRAFPRGPRRTRCRSLRPGWTGTRRTTAGEGSSRYRPSPRPARSMGGRRRTSPGRSSTPRRWCSSAGRERPCTCPRRKGSRPDTRRRRRPRGRGPP